MRGVGARVAVVFALVCAAACASSKTASPAVSPQGEADRTARRSSNMLVVADFQGLEALNLNDAIQRLRPDWLRRSEGRARGSWPGGKEMNDPLAVWVDDNRVGGVEILRQLTVQNVAAVRFYTGPEAQVRFGNGNSNGAIHVTTPRGGKKP